MKKRHLRVCFTAISALILSTSIVPVYAEEVTDIEVVVPQEDGGEFNDTYDAAIADTDIGRFVERLYNIVLGRKSDADGLRNWYNQLANRTMSGAEAGHGFVFSSEFTEKNLSNEEFVAILYNTFLDRQPDDSGKANWISELEQGVTRLSVFKGFVESDEYTEICRQYGINRGSVAISNYRDRSSNVTKFVVRCYRLILNREPDVDGLENWCQLLFEDQNSVDNIVKGFVFSQEMTDENLSNEDFIEMLYKTFLNRNSDPDGKSNWVSQLNNTNNRYDISCGFIYSDEFKKICRDYGIKEPAKPAEPEKHLVHHDEVGHWETVTISPAYDEPVYEYHTFCGTCGQDFGCGEAAVEAVGYHLVESENCQNYYSQTVQVGSTHHDAVTEQQWVVDQAAYDSWEY